jgi:gas vesicle structural protein
VDRAHRLASEERERGDRECIPVDRESVPVFAGRISRAVRDRSILAAYGASGGPAPLVQDVAAGGRMATIQHSTNGSSLAEVIDRILDRGCVIDAFVRVTLVGIELLAIEARIVIASVDTWLKYAEAVGLTTTFDQMADMPA